MELLFFSILNKKDASQETKVFSLKLVCLTNTERQSAHGSPGTAARGEKDQHASYRAGKEETDVED